MIIRGTCLVLLGLALALGSVLVTAQDAGQQEPEIADNLSLEEAARDYNQHVRSNFKLPKIFDFERYKQAFRKVYESSLEEMVRLKLYLARSYRVFISSVGYKHRGKSYYLAVNERSDWTKAELESSENKYLANDQGDISDLVLQEDDAHVEEDEYLDPEELEAELAEIERHTDEPRYAHLAEELRKVRDQAKSRRRRSAGAAAQQPRDFDIERAFDRSTSGRPGSEAKLEKIPSNNPEYQQPELMSRGSYADHLKRPDFKMPAQQWIYKGNWRDYSQLPVKSQYKTVTYLDTFWSLFGLSASTQDTRNVAPEGRRVIYDDDDDDNEEVSPKLHDGTDDVVWADQRRSNCLSEVQNQRQCGSCYAFAVTSFFEFAHCKETGELAKFSEQYLVDCGDKLQLRGCDGGNLEISAEFYANFGIELNQHYPYLARQDTCPYAPETEMAHMGYIRLDYRYKSLIPVQIWEHYLEHTVIVMGISTKGDFQEYGGGVWDGLKCDEKSTHALLVIGHGREDGEEYWLIRNSYGPSWGEEGHFRLNKNSNCIHPGFGYVWGTRDGVTLRLRPERNEHVPEPVAKETGYLYKGLIDTAGKTVSYLWSFLPGGGQAVEAPVEEVSVEDN